MFDENVNTPPMLIVESSSKFNHFNPLGTGSKLNVHKTFRRHPGHLLNGLCRFNLHPVFRGNYFENHKRYVWQNYKTPDNYCGCKIFTGFKRFLLTVEFSINKMSNTDHDGWCFIDFCFLIQLYWYNTCWKLVFHGNHWWQLIFFCAKLLNVKI